MTTFSLILPFSFLLFFHFFIFLFFLFNYIFFFTFILQNLIGFELGFIIYFGLLYIGFIKILNKHPRIWLVFNFMSFYFCYCIIK